MKSFLVDVPVRINIWIRTECQRRQFEIIKDARPSIIFLQSDGGRNEQEWKAIYDNRKMIDEGIDWDCKVYRLYEDSNNGLYAMSQKTQKLIWSTVDRCIFLEDDDIPSVSFFEFCAELLEKYKNDERISRICGMNHEGVSEAVTSDYFFSREGSIWGTATWKRVIDMRKNTFSYRNDSYILKLLKIQTKSNRFIWNQIVGYAKDEHFNGHVAGSEFYTAFDMYAQNMIQIVPKKNMIKNIGCTENSAHSIEYNLLPRAIQNIYDMETFELSFPLKHPGFVIPDIEFDKRVNRIMGRGHPLVLFGRKIESLLKLIKYRGVKSVICKINCKFGTKKMEN